MFLEKLPKKPSISLLSKNGSTKSLDKLLMLLTANFSALNNASLKLTTTLLFISFSNNASFLDVDAINQYSLTTIPSALLQLLLMPHLSLIS